MNARVLIRPAARNDLEAIVRLRTESILEAPNRQLSADEARRWAAVDVTERLLNRILDGCVLITVAENRIVAYCGMDLDQGEIRSVFVAPDRQHQGIGRRMVAGLERLAIRFGMTRLRVDAAMSAIEFFSACRYRPSPGAAVRLDSRIGIDALYMERDFPRRQTRYGARIRRLLSRIGIPADYGRAHRLQLQTECHELATVGIDALGREQLLQPEAAMAWYALRNAADDDGITLRVVSGFRSVGYQVTLIERKRRAGQSMDEILRVSAAPGFSEHHTGRAIDLTTPGSDPLEECFETTAAFEWLTESANNHGFRMSYPRNNRHGIAYEPWHWIWLG